MTIEVHIGWLALFVLAMVGAVCAAAFRRPDPELFDCGCDCQGPAFLSAADSTADRLADILNRLDRRTQQPDLLPGTQRRRKTSSGA